MLGGEEGKPGADIPTSLITDSDVNSILGWLVGTVEDKVMDEECVEGYNDYSRIVYEDNVAMIIDFDENGDLVFE